MNDTLLSSSDTKEGTATFAVGGLVVALAILSVALRFYTRLITKAGLWWDDWFALAAVLAAVLTAVPLIWGNAVDPNGEAVSDNTDPNYVYTPADVFYLQLTFVSSVLYFTIAGSAKLSILLMYNRLFSVDAAFRRQLIVASILVIGWWIGCTVATLTNCIPLEWSWLNGLSDARYCINYNIFWMASGMCEVLVDVIILTLPIRAIQKLQLSRKRKAAITLVFLLGGFVIITGLVKVILGFVPGSRVPSYTRTEVWTTVHVGMAIVCSCLPIFKPLLNRIAASPVMAKLTGSSSPSLRSRFWSGSQGWSVGSGRGKRSGDNEERSSESSVGCEFALLGGERSLRREQKGANVEVRVERVLGGDVV